MIRLTTPLIFSAVVLAALYAISTVVMLRIAASAPTLFGVSHGWSDPRSVGGFALYCVAIILAGFPFAWVLDHIYGQLAIPIAAATSIAIWGAFGGPAAVVGLISGQGHRPTAMILLLIQVIALPLLVWWLQRLPSNNRWRGP